MKFLKNFYNLTDFWRDSISVFYPQNSYMFFGLSFQAFLNLYKSFLKLGGINYFLLIFLLLLDGLVQNNSMLFFTSGLILLYVASLRLSVVNKNQNYYTQVLQYLGYVIIFLLIYPVFKYFSAEIIFLNLIFISTLYRKNSTLKIFYYPVVVLISGIFVFLMYLFFKLPIEIVYHYILDYMGTTNFFEYIKIFSLVDSIDFFCPVLILFLIFLLDSQKTLFENLRALLKSIKMFFYSYPFCFVLYHSFYTIKHIVKYSFVLFSKFFGYSPLYELIDGLINVLVILPLYISILSTFYISSLYNNFDFYYKKNE